MSTPNSSKRARLHWDPKSHPSERLNAELNHDYAHKVPYHLVSAPLTPSTSTVACSSSPRRAQHALSSSSPTRKPNASPTAVRKLNLELGKTFIFGRHHVRDASRPKPSITIESTVPGKLNHLVANPSNNVESIILSREAHHASRVHALVELVLPLSQTREKVMRIIAIGQNGMRVRLPQQALTAGSKDKSRKKGVRLVQGQRYDVPVRAGDQIELDFYGDKAIIDMLVDRAQSPEKSPLNQVLFPSSPVSRPALSSSMPPSSPPIIHDEIEDEEDEQPKQAESDEEDEHPFAQHLASPSRSPFFAAQSCRDVDAQSARSRESSPLSPISNHSALSDAEPEPKAEAPVHASLLSTRPSSPIHPSSPSYDRDSEPDAIQVKTERLENLPVSRTHSRKSTPARIGSTAVTAAPTVPAAERKAPPADVDRPAVIASTVVFSGSSKLSLPDLVKHMLEAQPHLKAHGDEDMWAIWVGEELESNPMFGKVERHGKDSAGHPLLPHYFYNPSADPDTQRASDLGGLVRPLRTAARGGQAIDWRPVGRRKRVW
ncbi:hypothetical protein C351_03780 [Cryptococcus neoformans c8]|nr:hypothetical protein C353_03906 [Cryptococcus neoformans var. grubii AD1-83a]OXG57195.1 hypothetical protein C354_03837 [Cryptococcus neoformans var. grubii MW-RSA1955]OXG61944.1 hypothetical protein C352_03852 [Cryptococcus neoformans var. grubii CHC193]OXG62327.1 hypothetical protein C351_03780 [Cryptococcus neoformans var. grubii c8]OXH08825.1 hypothetical protein C369_03877 [Cryptococcus neoformans var. grubii A5-35-17]OXH10123.1 hypothetical protein C370_03948 [Cryptococcus neoformans 